MSSNTPCPSANKIASHALAVSEDSIFSQGIAPMEGKELVVLRNEAVATLKSPLATEPAARDRKSLLPVFAVSALFSVAAMMWLHILADTKTSPIPSVQSVSIQAQTPPPEVEIARPFETMTAVDEPTQRPQQVAVAEPEPAELTQPVAIPEPALSKFQAWAAQRNADAPTESAEPPRVEPATDAPAKASAAQDREREQEALADKRWEERHTRRLAAARKPARSAPAPQQAQQAQAQQKPQQPQQAQAQQKPQQPQQQSPQKPQSAPTASASAPVVPQPSNSQRGGG